MHTFESNVFFRSAHRPKGWGTEKRKELQKDNNESLICLCADGAVNNTTWGNKGNALLHLGADHN